MLRIKTGWLYSIDGIINQGYYIYIMSWEVEYTDEFEQWWHSLTEREQTAIDASVRLLELFGPTLRFPHSSGVKGSRHGHMRELRTRFGGRPFRTLYAFDPMRNAILLIGGDKTGNDRWYEEFVPLADDLYDEHLDVLGKEGLFDGKEIL
jgi:hypothetical protein